MQAQRFGNLFADGENGIERRHRILKDHGDVVAAHLAHLGVGKFEQIFAVEKYLAVDNFSRRRDRDA